MLVPSGPQSQPASGGGGGLQKNDPLKISWTDPTNSCRQVSCFGAQSPEEQRAGGGGRTAAGPCPRPHPLMGILAAGQPASCGKMLGAGSRLPQGSLAPRHSQLQRLPLRCPLGGRHSGPLWGALTAGQSPGSLVAPPLDLLSVSGPSPSQAPAPASAALRERPGSEPPNKPALYWGSEGMGFRGLAGPVRVLATLSAGF